jgi:amino acid transporter
MNRSTISGLILAVIGIILFAYQDIARVMQKRTVVHAASVRRNDAAQKAEQAFPLASLLAGFLFMSGIGLVAVSAHPIVLPRQENPDRQA